MKVITSPLFRRKKNGTPVTSYIQLLYTYSSSFSTWSSKPTLQENEERPPASLQHFEKKHTERLSSKSPFFLNCILVRREWSCKKENDHRPTTQVCVRCFCRHDVLRPNRETKVFMEAAKSHPFLNKKINFQKLYLPCSLGFMFILSSCKSSTIFGFGSGLSSQSVLEVYPVARACSSSSSSSRLVGGGKTLPSKAKNLSPFQE